MTRHHRALCAANEFFFNHLLRRGQHLWHHVCGLLEISTPMDGEANGRMAFENSVTNWLQALQAGDREATRHLWKRYFHRMMGLARLKLGDPLAWGRR